MHSVRAGSRERDLAFAARRLRRQARDLARNHHRGNAGPFCLGCFSTLRVALAHASHCIVCVCLCHGGAASAWANDVRAACCLPNACLLTEPPCLISVLSRTGCSCRRIRLRCSRPRCASRCWSCGSRPPPDARARDRRIRARIARVVVGQANEGRKTSIFDNGASLARWCSVLAQGSLLLRVLTSARHAGQRESRRRSRSVHCAAAR